MSKKQRIAILGGGVAGLVTAFELTNSPDWKSKYEITLYQQGHRPGGKCASSRSRKHYGAGFVERIEEHGLHVFFGFYENAFGVMRNVYRELGELPRRADEQRRLTFDQAFLPHDLVMLGTDLGDRLHSWSLPFPRRDGKPGIADDTNPTSLDGGTALAGLVELVVAQWLDVADIQEQGLGARSPGNHEVDSILASLKNDGIDEDVIADSLRMIRVLTRLLRGLVSPADAVRALRLAQAVLTRMGRMKTLRRPLIRRLIADLLVGLRDAALASLSPLPLNSFRIHELRVSLDLALTLAAGLVREDLLHPDVDWHALDGEDYRVWLRRHGAEDETVRSAPLLTLAAAAFSDPVNAGAGAGTTLRLTLRLLLTYKQAVVFRLGAGMGETAIAPLYRVLDARGVKFCFFHRVERIVPGKHGDESVVSQIDMRIQASVKKGADAYDPLSSFGGMLCWPDVPDYNQLEQGEELRRSGENLEDSWNRWDARQPVESLMLGRDFDAVVLGISMGGLKHLCTELADDADLRPRLARGERSYAPRLSEMLNGVRTVETMAAQLWLRPEFRELGAPAERGIGIAYPQPFDTWAEMDHLLPHERWHVPDEPASLIYLCSAMDEPQGYEPPPFSDHEHPARQRALVKRITKNWLDDHGSRIFTRARRPGGGFDYEQLIDPQHRRGEARFDAQFICATTNPSDRYVLAAPGTTRHRLRPHESGFRNLILSGDWTLNSVSAGCVESAITSGKDAARAMIGSSVQIVDDWLTRVKPWLLCKPVLASLPNYAQGAADAELPRPSRVPYLHGVPRLDAPRSDATYSPERQSGVTRLDLPVYQRRPFDIIPRPLYHCKNTRTDWFFFRADMAALQDICDEMLNFDASPTYYRPLAPMVAFVAAQLGNTYSDKERLGYMPEKDFAFWIPVVAMARPGRESEHRASPLAWLQPCLWVDSCPAVVGGRDIFGVNKALAELRAASASSPLFSVDTIALRDEGALDANGEPTSQAVMERILELRVDQELDAWDVLNSFSGLRDVLEKRIDFNLLDPEELSWLEQLYAEARARTMPLVALKMFPDVERPERACYKAIIEAPSRVTELKSVRPWAGTHELRVFHFDSHPIVKRLGLSGTVSEENGYPVTTVKSFFAVTMQFDFVLDVGTVLCDLTKVHAESLREVNVAE
jgi:uncharacterized protein with NAD-binding domain and iron-sulfur cluster